MDTRQQRTERLKQELEKRILVLDGAMGTMIQSYKLEEKDYRGDRFANFHMEIKGNNDLLSITQPDIIQKIHEDYLESGLSLIHVSEPTRPY